MKKLIFRTVVWSLWCVFMLFLIIVELPLGVVFFGLHTVYWWALRGLRDWADDMDYYNRHDMLKLLHDL